MRPTQQPQVGAGGGRGGARRGSASGGAHGWSEAVLSLIQPPRTMAAFTPPPALRAVLVGSGSDGMNEAEVHARRPRHD